jgi:hypothetical protein
VLARAASLAVDALLLGLVVLGSVLLATGTLGGVVLGALLYGGAALLALLARQDVARLARVPGSGE